MATFGQILRQARRKRGMSQRELGMVANISSAAINRYERGDRSPTRENIERLGDALRVSVKGRAVFYISVGLLPASPVTRKVCAELLLHTAEAQ